MCKRKLVTRFGADTWIALGTTEASIKKTMDIIPNPTKTEFLGLGNCFIISRLGGAMHFANRVLVGKGDPWRPWILLGLVPLSSASEFGTRLFGRKVGEVVRDEKGTSWRIMAIDIPDLTGESLHELPQSKLTAVS